jgi:hypothetical protein
LSRIVIAILLLRKDLRHRPLAWCRVQRGAPPCVAPRAGCRGSENALAFAPPPPPVRAHTRTIIPSSVFLSGHIAGGGEGSAGAGAGAGPGTPGGAGTPVSAAPELAVILFSDLVLVRKLGAGAFGEVEHRKWRGTNVAVKRNGMDAGDKEALAREINLNRALLVRPHPHVVQVLGVCTDAPDGMVRMVMRMCAKGTVYDQLIRARLKVSGHSLAVRCCQAGPGLLQHCGCTALPSSAAFH